MKGLSFRSTLLVSSSLSVLGLSLLSSAQADTTAIAKVLDEGKNRNQAIKHLHHLTKKIGARLTGSPQLQRAEQWAASKMREFGLQNVHSDKWGETPHGFERGPKQVGRQIEPYEKDFVFSTPAWTVGTNGVAKGHPVLAPTSKEEFEKIKSQLKGAWLLMGGSGGMRGTTRTSGEVDKLCDEAGILGRVYSSGSELVWTYGPWNRYTDETRPKTPIINIRKEDYEAVTYSLAHGRKVALEFEIDNRIYRKPVPIHNIIGDIPGSEKPDEFVIVSGHLDSWNGPGSEGACDNGTGTSVTLEVARLLMKAGIKPKRTIRFILWTGEEQGLYGSRYYCEKYKDQMDKISAILNEDAGPNWHASVAGTEDMLEMLNKAIEPMKNAFEGMPVKVVKIENFSTMVGSDHGPFIGRGVPGLYLLKGGNHPYRRVWHTQNDKFEEVEPKNVAQMSTNLAILALNLSCADALLPRAKVGSGGSNRRGGQAPSRGGTFEEEHDCAAHAFAHELLWIGMQFSKARWH